MAICLHGNLSAWVLGDRRQIGWLVVQARNGARFTYVSVSQASPEDWTILHPMPDTKLETINSKPFNIPPVQMYTMHGSLANVEASLSAH